MIVDYDKNSIEYRITENEKLVIYASHLSAERSDKEIGRRTGIPPHTVRYILGKLSLKGLIHRRPFVDIRALGLIEYAIFFSAVFDNPAARSNLISLLSKHDIVGDVVELAGEYAFMFNVFARSDREVDELLSSVFVKVGARCTKRKMQIRSSSTYFQRKYLSTVRSRGDTDEINSLRAASAQYLSDDDHRILLAMQENPESSRRDLSETLRMPISTLLNKISRLQKQRILLGEVYGVSIRLMGYHVYRVLVKTTQRDLSLNSLCYSFARKNPFVFVFCRAMGEWDYEFVVEVSQVIEISRFIQDLERILLETVLDISVCQIVRYHKASEYPFTRNPAPGSLLTK